jgi:hypothetical protein
VNTPTKKPTYPGDIADIALNDEPTILDINDVAGQITVVMAGWRWGLEAEQVAADVISFRRNAHNPD